MTAIYSIFARLPLSNPMPTPPVTRDAITAVIPAFNDQVGLTQTLESLDRLGLAQIIVTDDGSVPRMWLPPSLNTPTRLIRHSVNRGAATARNTALNVVKSDWVYFTDCGCSQDENLIDSFCRQRETSDACTVALVGPVEAQKRGRLAQYYTHQGILNAPMAENELGELEVETIVTANALVYRKAIKVVGRFDEAFPSAGGEDTDLGIRLRTVGKIEWCEAAKVVHTFKECLVDFDNRMHRYGKGIRLVSDKFGFDLRPRPFPPFDPLYVDLADRQYRKMLGGFNEESNAK